MEAKNEKQRIRKADIKKGERTQKMMTFRCDLDNVEWLEQQANKGRYINDLIRMDRGRKK